MDDDLATTTNARFPAEADIQALRSIRHSGLFAAIGCNAALPSAPPQTDLVDGPLETFDPIADAAVQLHRTSHSLRLQNLSAGELEVCGTFPTFAASAPMSALGLTSI